MPKAQKELSEVNGYLVTWLTEIAVYNALTYFDINKISEGIAARLLNLLYGWNLTDLNDKELNFSAVDLGDTENAKLAIQVTSRTDTRKIRRTLKSFTDSGYLKEFPNGVKFLILSSGRRPVLSEKSQISYSHFFDSKRDILTIRNLLVQAKKIYYEDPDTFTLLHQFLDQEFGTKTIKKNDGLVSFRSSGEKVLFFKKLFAANQEARTRNFVPVEYLSDKQLLTSISLKDGAWLDHGLIIFGPSGCGKSVLARQLCLNALDRVFPVILEAKYYENGIQTLFRKEIQSYGFESESEFFEEAKSSGQLVLLVIDGLNECCPEFRFKIALEVQRAMSGRRLVVIITTQVAEPLLEDLHLPEIFIQHPSPEIRQAIALAYGSFIAPRKLRSILAVVSSGLEARMVGEMEAVDLLANGRYALFAGFIKRKLAGSHVGGFLLMALIARAMSSRITFSLSIRSVEGLLLDQMLSSQVYVECLRAGVLEERGGKISFSHEMFFDFSVADSVGRFANDSGDILDALNAPKNSDKKILILGAVDDTQLLDGVLANITDSNLFVSLLDGEAGDYVQSWTRRRLSGLLPKVEDEIRNCVVQMTDEYHYFDFDDNHLTSWSEHEMALLCSLPEGLVDGMFLNEMLSIIATMDEVCDNATRKFSEQAKAKNISARSGIFSTTYSSISHGKLAMSRLFSIIHSGFFSLHGKGEISIRSLSELTRNRALTPGQVLLLLLLFRYDDRLQVLYPTVLNILKEWRRYPYSLLTETLQQIGHICSDESQRVEIVDEISKILSTTQNAWLSTQLFDALGSLGALDDDANAYIPVVKQDIADILSSPLYDNDACERAATIFHCQYDHLYDSAFYTAIEQLDDNEKKAFLQMALRGWRDGMFTSSLIIKASSLLGSVAMNEIVRWTVVPIAQPTFPVDSLGVFLICHLLLGQHNHALPQRSLDGPDLASNSIRALAELHYWYQRDGIEPDVLWARTVPLADKLFAPNNDMVVDTLWQSRLALYNQSYHSKLDLSKVELILVNYRQKVVDACRRALLDLSWQKSIWKFPDSIEDMNRHAIQLLAEVGSPLDLDVLRPLSDHIKYGTYAVDAIRKLGG
nr:SMEK domain-containing protein [uncultured Dyadobacter sp.]